ncbi:MAG: hypothetical protein R2690_04085 [Acidimicrobiales bacterium]
MIGTGSSSGGTLVEVVELVELVEVLVAMGSDGAGGAEVVVVDGSCALMATGVAVAQPTTAVEATSAATARCARGRAGRQRIERRLPGDRWPSAA